MSVRVIESGNKSYLRYEIRVKSFKDDILKIEFTDNYFDKNDYMFVDNSTGELYSYNDVALKFCTQIANKIGFHFYKVNPGDNFYFYLDGPHGAVVDVTNRPKSIKTESAENSALNGIRLSVGRKVSIFQNYDKQVRDDFLIDIADDCKKLSEALENGNMADAQKLTKTLKLDADSLITFASTIQMAAEGLKVQLEKIQKMK